MKRLIFKILLILLFQGQIFSQESDSIKICDFKLKVKNQTELKRKTEIELDYKITVIQDFYINGNIKSETYWIHKNTPIWRKEFYDRNGKLIKIVPVDNEKYGLCYVLHQAQEKGLLGDETYIDLFSKNNFEYPNHWFIGYDFNKSETGHETKGIVIDKNTGNLQDYYTSVTIYPDSVFELGFSTLEIMPEFQGGFDSLRNYLQSQILIPQDSIVNGQVFVEFWIDTDGKPVDARIIRGINNYQDKEALRIVNSMPKWNPGENNGEKRKVSFTIPIIFKKTEE
ncbi:MAG: energy transducer TonB [Bacteroidota bacterium]|nr:energy transducer TonB [Bacteroidota bacterium]